MLCPTKPHAITKEQIPLTLGHELSGIVEEVGEGVTRYKPGDRVVLEPVIYDETCGACKAGYFNCCISGGFVGVSGYGGGFSEHLVLDAKYFSPLPNGVSLQVGGKCQSTISVCILADREALVEPLCVAWRAAECANLTPEDSVLILGGGPIGLAILLCLQAQGISKVIVSEIASGRKQLAHSLRASHVLDPTTEDVVSRTIELCDGQGASAAFDCAGVQVTLDTAIRATRAKGTIVNVAVWEKPPVFPVNPFLYKEKVYRGTAAPEHKDFVNVLRALADGKLKPLDLVTKRIGLHEVKQEGFDVLIKDRSTHAKVLVEIGGGE
jgi:threonine dehydrogenase-like Zn-dependent dehydrogenase